MRIFIAAICISLLICNGINAQLSVEQMLVAGQCELFDSSVPLECTSILARSSRTVWTAPSLGLSQQSLASQLFNVAPPFNLSVTSPLFAMHYDCAFAYMRLWCGTALQQCSEAPAELVGVSALFHAPCKSVCRDANDQCADFWRQNGAPPIDCDQLSQLGGGVEQWPELNVSEGTPFVCDSMPIEMLGALEYECPPPLIFVGPDRADPLTGLPCSASCRTQSTWLTPGGESAFEAGFITLSVLGWISIVGVVVVIVTYAAFEALRAFPQRLVPGIGIGLFFLLLNLVISSFRGTFEFGCDDDITLSVSGACRASAFFLWLGGLLTGMYWTMFALTLFHNVALSMKPERIARIEWLIHLLAWSVSLGFSIGVVSVDGWLGFQSTIPYCMFTTSTPSYVNWSFFNGFLLGCAVLVVVCMTVVVVRVWRSVRSTEGKSYRNNISLQLSLFTITFAIVIASSVASLAVYERDRDSSAQSIEDWYACVFSAGVLGDCNIEPTPASIYWIIITQYSAIGIYFFLVFFVFSAHNRALWPKAFANWRAGRPVFDVSMSTTSRGTAHSSPSTQR
jgi:Frizzled/Smoothened family membrane region